MLTPDVSVIVPVHNSIKFLGECLDSLLRQTYQHIEIICVNDGSCDGSGSVLKEYAKNDERVRIKTTECHGVGSARNTGIDLAKGRYVFFVDSDDLLHRDALSNFMKIAVKTDADIVCGKYKKLKNPCVQDEKELTGDFYLETNPISCFGQRPSKTPVTVWNKLFKKEVIKDVRFLPGMYYEDTAFSLDVFSRAHSCALTSDVTYFYRTGNSSIMRSSNTEQKINDFSRVLSAVDETFKDQPEIHRLIFSTYLSPELLGLLSFQYGISRHLRRYMNEHIQPIIKKVKKRSATDDPNSDRITGKNLNKTRLVWEILKAKIFRN